MAVVHIILGSTALEAEELLKMTPVVQRIAELKWDHMVVVTAAVEEE